MDHAKIRRRLGAGGHPHVRGDEEVFTVSPLSTGTGLLLSEMG
jgi:hypothetical protein